MTRDEERTLAREHLLTALKGAQGQGVTETHLRRATAISVSLFHEVMPELLEEGRVVVSHRDGRRYLTEYHLLSVPEHHVPPEGPLSLLAAQVLARIGTRADGARGVAKALGVDLAVVQQALDELETFRLVGRSQVGMLSIYRATP